MRIHPARRKEVSRADLGRLGGLAHFTTRYRWPVIAGWIALTIFGGYAAGQLSSRWYQSLAVPGQPAYEASQRTLKTLGAGDRSPSTVVFHSSSARRQQEPGGAPGDGAGGAGESRRAHELVLLDRQPDVRVRGRAHDVPAGLSSRPRRPRREERRRGHPGRRGSRASGRHQRRRDRARRARRSEHHARPGDRASCWRR